MTACEKLRKIKNRNGGVPIEGGYLYVIVRDLLYRIPID